MQQHVDCILIISILAILPHMSAYIDSKAPTLVYYKRTRRIEKNFTKKYFLEFTQVAQSRCRIELKTNKQTKRQRFRMFNDNLFHMNVTLHCFLISWALDALKKYIIFSFKRIARTKMCHILLSMLTFSVSFRS